MNMKNSVTTQGYFIKRLRDSGFVTVKLYDTYGTYDPRKWTVMVDPGGASVIITCYQNKETRGDIEFEFNDGGSHFKNYFLRTQSMEIIIMTLIEKHVPQIATGSTFTKKTPPTEG